MPYDPITLWEWEGGALGPDAQPLPDPLTNQKTPSARSRPRRATPSSLSASAESPPTEPSQKDRARGHRRAPPARHSPR
jgi:hypothetical protein